jgi:ActR/RegA family two-component response regulator/AraC-like DNA-binding protein
MHHVSGAASETSPSRLPLCAGRPYANGSSPATPSSGAAQSSARVPRFLWIDDDIGADHAAVRLMELEGVEVECAQTGAAGLVLALTNVYDGIILDLRLPDLGGMAILGWMLAAGVSAPVLMLTGFGDIDTAVAAVKMGAADFRAKPILGDEIAIIMKTLMGRQSVRLRHRPHGRHVVSNSEGRGIRGDQRTLEHSVAAMIRPDVTVVEFIVLMRALRQRITGRRLKPRSHQVSGPTRGLDLAASVLQRIQEHLALGRLPSIDDIAKSLGLERADLRRILTGATGAGFCESRRAIRVRPSLAAVAFSEEQFAQIAYRIGYEHPSQFDRDFHLAFGVTPSELRQVLRSGDPIC